MMLPIVPQCGSNCDGVIPGDLTPIVAYLGAALDGVSNRNAVL
jgi:hypothetical protein